MQIYHSIISGRAKLFSRLGQQYDGSRDIYQALGYPLELKFEDYAAQYSRQDIAKAIIDRPVNATWQGGVTISESTKADETELEKAWKELNKDLKLVSKFGRLDKLTGIGEYGVFLLGLDDVQKPGDMKEPVNITGDRKLLFVKPISQGNATIKKWISDTTDPRYGMPETYTITIKNKNESFTTSEVHHTRVIHVADGLLESETEGVPRLKPVFNRLKDLEKIVGGSAEMFWRGARPGYKAKADKDYQITQDTKNDLKDQFDEYEHNLRRILAIEGIDIDTLDSQVSDPKSHVDVQIEMISTETGIPKRIFTGSEKGELASSEDKDSWLFLIKGRRDNFAEPEIVRAFVDRCIEYGILPEAKDEYTVKWVDLFAQSDKDKAEVGKTRATALKEYSMNPTAESHVPPKAFYRLFLGLEEDNIEMIEQIKREAIGEEEDFFSETQVEE